MGLTEDDIDEDFIAEARAVLATGTHLSHPRTEAAVLKALTLARKHGARTALDIDYRPNLWGVAGHGEGESRFVESAEVTRKLQATLHLFDLIVGTEEEFHIAGGSTDTSPRSARCGRSRTPPWSASAARRGAVAFDGRDPGEPRRRPDRSRLPDRGLQRARRRRRLLLRPAQGLAHRPGLADQPEVRQRLRRLRGLAPRLHPGLSVAGPSSSSSSDAASSARTCATTRRSSRCTGRPTGSASMAATGRRCGSSPSTTGCSSRQMDGRDAREDRRLQAALPAGGARGAGRPPGLRHPLRQPARTRRRCMPPRALASGSAGRANGRARGR